MLQGFRTVLIGALMAVAPALTEYLGAVKWEDFMSPTTAFFVSGAIMMGLRFITNSGVFKKS